MSLAARITRKSGCSCCEPARCARMKGMYARANAFAFAFACALRPALRARVNAEWPQCMRAHLTFSLSPLSPLFFSFFIIVPLAREKSHHLFLDGASGAFGEAFGGFPHCRARLLVPLSRLFHDLSSGFWCTRRMAVCARHGQNVWSQGQKSAQTQGRKRA